jgi:hypothetical protein
MIQKTQRAATVLAAVAIPASLMIAGAGAAAASPAGARAAQLTVRQVVNGMKLHHKYTPAGSSTPKTEPLAQPDDLTNLGPSALFAAFQNGVGPQGQASIDGNLDSTVVEFGLGGQVIKQWDIKGKCDGLTADPALGVVIATVNEDANSSLYTIAPGAPSGAAVQHYAYNEPLPHNGGTDAISVYHRQILISASAPGTTGAPAPQPTYPAVYRVSLDATTHLATVSPLFFDEATATVANVGPTQGTKVKLALTDPDSNEIAPPWAPRFAGQFMVTSQGDKQQIFVRENASAAPTLHVLNLSNSVDDTAWTGPGPEILFAADHDGDTVDAVTGTFPRNSVIVAVTPCDASDAPPTCPGPGFPPNYLGQLNPWTGHLSRLQLTGPRLEPQGLMFIAQP